MSNNKEFKEYLNSIPTILEETGTSGTIEKAHTQYIEFDLINESTPLKTLVQGDLNLISSTLENIALDLYINSEFDEATKMFESAFICRRNYITINKKYELEQLFYLSVSALGAKRSSELRLTLNEHEIANSSSSQEWPELIKFNVIRAFLLLCRKKNGWNDIKEALGSIDTLRRLQKDFEETYLEKVGESGVLLKLSNIGKLIALYNLAKIIEIAGTYLTNASPANPNIKIKKHFDNAIEAVEKSGENFLRHFSDMVYTGCDLLIKNSIWYSTRTLGVRARNLVEELANMGRKNPFIELWPSQQEALKSSLFDMAKRSIVMQMPTSAGKTLMAEFAIVQSHALNPDSTVIYVVPTRALVNQTTLQLRKDLGPLNLVTESAVPVFELDPTESELLKKECDILVSTPEKIELLIRVNHPIVRDVSLVVVDEVHNISGDTRGSTLELFLGNISREKPNARFLLMSPFIPNADEIGAWLGSDLSAKISVEWRPSERITAATTYSGRKPNKFVKLVTLPSVHNSDVKEEIEIPIESKIVEGAKTKENIALSSALSLVGKGSVLVLCSGRDSAVQQAKKATQYMPEAGKSELLDVTINFIKDELGENHVLPRMINKGVAFHHAGLSQESRYLIERLVERGDIKLICATTTLAQGVNFPIRTVIIEAITRPTVRRGHQKIPYNEFWNIAGRAGRAMKDHLGLVLFAARDSNDIDKYKEYLQDEARDVISSIREDLEKLTDIGEYFDRKFVFNYPSLARFFQYLLHAITVSDYKTIKTETEDVLRSSLVYHQVNKENPEFARRLVQIARLYLDQIAEKAENRGMLQLVDGTGFSSISVDFLWKQRDKFSDTDIWDKKNLFSLDDSNLNEMIEVLSGIPELDLTRLGRGELDTKAIADIIKEWVVGESLEGIADKYFSVIKDKDERILQTSRYIHSTLVGQLAWGMSALLKVSMFGKEDVNWEEVGHIPALMYYGVSSKDAAVLRMIGVPRKSAEKLASKYLKELSRESPTFQQIRKWLDKTNDGDWEDLTKKSKMTGKESKMAWKVLNGIE